MTSCWSSGTQTLQGPGQSPVIGKPGGEGWVQALWGRGPKADRMDVTVSHQESHVLLHT